MFYTSNNLIGILVLNVRFHIQQFLSVWKFDFIVKKFKHTSILGISAHGPDGYFSILFCTFEYNLFNWNLANI